MRRIRSRLTYANVMSTLAAFFAIGGAGAYAAHEVISSSDIVDESILSQDIRDKQVKVNDIALEAVTTGRIKQSGVRSDRIQDGSVAGVDIAPDAITSEHVAAGAITGADVDLGSMPFVEGDGRRFASLQSISPGSTTELFNVEGFGTVAVTCGPSAQSATVTYRNLDAAARVVTAASTEGSTAVSTNGSWVATGDTVSHTFPASALANAGRWFTISVGSGVRATLNVGGLTRVLGTSVCHFWLDGSTGS